MMAINRYRLSMIVRLMLLAFKLLNYWHVLIIYNHSVNWQQFFSNVAIASIGTIIGLRVGGDLGAMIASAVLAVSNFTFCRD